MSAWRSAPGGSTAAERWICALENGRRAFVKWSDEDADRPVLVLEDLSHATWPPPYIDRVLASISDVAATPVPPGLPRLADQQSEVFTGWTTVARDPRAFLSLGRCSAEWLERSIDRLVRAEADADVSGESFLHRAYRLPPGGAGGVNRALSTA